MRNLLLKCQLLLVMAFSMCSYLEATQPPINHESRLPLLKAHGFHPKVIYDIGAFKGTWTMEMKKIFPEAKYFMFEANEAHTPYLMLTREPFFIAALGDKEAEMTFYSNNSTGDSLLKEQTHYYEGDKCEQKCVQMTTLANVVKKNNLPLPDFIKIDVQGAEKWILQGSPDVIKNAEVVILETKILEYNQGAPLLLEILNLMDSLGYRILDIVEMHYLATQELNEIDVLFVKKDSNFIKRGLLQ